MHCRHSILNIECFCLIGYTCAEPTAQLRRVPDMRKPGERLPDPSLRFQNSNFGVCPKCANLGSIFLTS